jgi:hypothetical protein
MAAIATISTMEALGTQIRAQLQDLEKEIFVKIPEGDIVIQDRVEYERKKRWRRIGLVASLAVSVGSFVVILYRAIADGEASNVLSADTSTPTPVQPVAPSGL